ncbi:MAG TPA: hypothetical protein VEY49_05720 [Solirubrobacteraceae bacterium]|jgi:hypothetical protein|nr:hypothetical protein [Solirubrobacteraceae bacterium]
MSSAATRTLRGALAGTAAAAVWAAQQPLDRRVFDVPYDDVELLGRLVVRSERWQAAGLGLHLLNGAAFGAAYANLAPSLPVPPVLRGPLAGLVEHLATWPGTALIDRLHPARAELPRLWGSRPAFAQSAWRHALFGLVLGELERRLNPPTAPVLPVDDRTASTNGHGSGERVATPGPARL